MGHGRYLVALWGYAELGHHPAQVELAGKLGVTTQSVNQAVTELRVAGAVADDRRRPIRLTALGTALARDAARRARLVEWLLADALRFGWADIADEAPAWARTLSPHALDRLDEQLGHPAACPHGNPIPRAGPPQLDGRPLTDVEAGTAFTVLCVPELVGSPAMLQFLQDSAATPGAHGHVCDHGPGGTCVVHLPAGPVALAADTARWLHVATRPASGRPTPE